MSRHLDWSKARRSRAEILEQHASLERAADAFLARRGNPPKKKARKLKVVNKPPPADTGKNGDGIWIVLYEGDRRIVHHFRSLAVAHANGFTWAS